jgi:hypothetical protein
MPQEMTDTCRALVDGVRQRMKKAERLALLRPRAERQAFIYEETFRNEIEAVAFFLAENLGRIPDFANPTTYPELLRGQFLTHPNPLMSIAADKIAMRDYCDLFDLPIRPVPLIASFDTPEDLDPRDLPPNCMVKIADGCKMNILHGPGLPLTPFAYRSFLRRFLPIDHWRRHAELHYRDIPKRVLVEKALLPIRDIKETFVYCAMGEPYLAIRGSLVSTLRDDLAPLASMSARKHVPIENLAPHPEVEPMLETARKVASSFLHCRVDFMHIDGQSYLGEITMSPGGYYRPVAPDLEALRASLLDMSRLPELAETGRTIAAKLGRPTETSFGHFSDDPRLATGGQ